MSLQVWLPLNGNLNNQGLDGNLGFTNTASASVASDGKLGQCYYFSSTSGNGILLSSGKSASEFMDAYINHHSWSICAWIRTTSDDNVVFGLTYGLRLWCGSTNYINLYNETRNVGASNSISTIDGKWHHICATYNTVDNAINVYVDGIKGTTTYYPSGETYASSWTNAVAIGRDFNNSTAVPHYYFQGSINDVRIYDHCLSAKEVKEISKGLICHYKLDNSGFGGENLILESHRVVSGADASGITSTYMDDGLLKVVSTSGNGQWKSCGFSKDSNSNVGNKLSVGDTYTISLDVKIEEGNSLPSLFINNGNPYRALQPVNGKIVNNSWFRAYYTNTWYEPGTSYGNISIHLNFGGAIGTFYFKNFKLEKGSKPTQWCPSPLDDNALGLNLLVEPDCSGYRNNGIKVGNVFSVESGGRYSTSTYCNSTNIGVSTPTGAAFIKCSLVNPIVNVTALTINWWGNIEDYSYQDSGILSLSNDSSYPIDYLNSALAQYDSTFRFNLTNGNDSSINSLALIETGSWHMYTLVFNNGEVLGYRDGVLVAHSNKSGTLAQFAYVYMGINVAGGAYRQTKSKWSDFRIYSTALSASDIKELYNTSASVDKNDNMYAYEFKEE